MAKQTTRGTVPVVLRVAVPVSTCLYGVAMTPESILDRLNDQPNPLELMMEEADRQLARHMLSGVLDEISILKAANAMYPEVWAVLRSLKRGDCFCDMAINSPMCTRHTDECNKAMEMLKRMEEMQ
jgi:hypothetical protein